MLFTVCMCFKNGDFSVEDKPHCGQPKNSKTKNRLADTLRVTQEAVPVRLKTMRMIEKQGNWVLYELKSRNADFAACQRSVQCSKSVKTYLETLKWEVLPHAPYSPDVTPSDYHFF